LIVTDIPLEGAMLIKSLISSIISLSIKSALVASIITFE